MDTSNPGTALATNSTHSLPQEKGVQLFCGIPPLFIPPPPRLSPNKIFFYTLQPLSRPPPAGFPGLSPSLQSIPYSFSSRLGVRVREGEARAPGRGVIPKQLPPRSQRDKRAMYVSAPPPKKMPLLLTPK